MLKVDKLTLVTEYFVICSGSNPRQLQTIAYEIEKAFKKAGISRLGIEGYEDAKWILLDYGDVIIHLFDKKTRVFYDLDLLWGDAPKISWEAGKPLSHDLLKT